MIQSPTRIMLKGDLKRLLAAHEAGAALTQLAKAYGCATDPVRDVLIEAGATLHPARPNREERRRGERAIERHFGKNKLMG